jgi:hypothetical protein
VFLDPTGKKALRSEKAGMHVHDVVTSDKAESLIAVGHNRIAVYEMKG